jgi:glycine cleavage system H lipoate-binding protein
MLGSLKQIDGSLTSQRCWWMLAGVVDYKLCDRDFDCEHCPFDLILHGDESQLERTGPPPQGHAIGEGLHFDLLETLFYHPAHLWVRVEDCGNARIGLDDFAQKLLGRAYSVTLPHEGVVLKSGAHSWSVTHKTGDTKLVVPVEGVVIDVNTKLLQCPSLLNRDPFGSGWAFMIKPTDLKAGLGNLFYGSQAKAWHREQKEKLYLLASKLSGASGPSVLPDGGVFRKDFLSELSSEDVLDLINSFLPGPSGTDNASNDGAAISNLKRR